jgi:hypothetical protein
MRKISKIAVSDVIGTAVLLGVAVSIFAVVYMVVLSQPIPQTPPKVTLVGTVEGKNIVIEHRGGEDLSLDTKITVSFDGSSPGIIKVGDYLDAQEKQDGKWSVGERVCYPIPYTINSKEADVTAVDPDSNTMVMVGTLDIRPECDIGVKCTVNNQNPQVGTNIIITLTATHYRGDVTAPVITVKFLLPAGLQYISDTPAPGTSYDRITGNWSITSLNIGQSTTLAIEAKVIGTAMPTSTQFALLLDGSPSITSTDWNIMRTGLKTAILNGSCFPHDGSVELTVIQFGASAFLEIGGPIIVNETNYVSIANNVGSLTQRQGYTAMSCAFNLAADVLSGDPHHYLVGTSWAGKASHHFIDFPRKVINLVTDGKPNVICNQGQYSGTYDGNPYGTPQSKVSTENARNYLLATLNMTADQDEIDSEAVGSGPDVPWLRDAIVSPQPGIDTWPPSKPGWVRIVTDYTEFADIIDEQFYLLFNNIPCSVEILPSSILDPNPSNNEFFITISPHG